ncbi:MAG: hypothetical protein ACFFG0_03730 [Candidatus Thorarchaeota archaeon]
MKVHRTSGKQLNKCISCSKRTKKFVRFMDKSITLNVCICDNCVGTIYKNEKVFNSIFELFKTILMKGEEKHAVI